MSLRRWTQLDAGSYYPDILPYPDFVRETESLGQTDLCSTSEAYSALSFLQAKARRPTPHVDLETRCYYFTAINPHLSTDEESVTDYVVSVGVSCISLTPKRLESLFRLGGQWRDSIVLALVDSDGTTTISRLTRGIFPPSERPPMQEGEEDEDDD